MADVSDMDLMGEYAERNSEAAFAELVNRHINLVYSVALRFTGNSGDAEDVTQAVFVMFAQKAVSLRQRTTLTGWLYETTRFTARQLLRGRARQQAREQEAYLQSTLNVPDTNTVWRQLAPLLEEAMRRLNESERTLLALRFFENKSGTETAVLLGIQEWAAHKRAARALEKLRKFFTKRGVSSTAAGIAAAMAANSVQAAPAAVIRTATAVAFAKGATASGSTLTLIKGALKLMAGAKAKISAITVAGVLLAAGTVTVAVREIQAHGTYRGSWQVKEITMSQSILERMPSLVQILPTRFARFKTVNDGIGVRIAAGNKMAGLRQPVSEIILKAYGGSSPVRMLAETELPPGEYDFVTTVPVRPMEALKQEIMKRFGLIARREMRETSVLLLRIKNPNAPGLLPTSGKPAANNGSPGHILGVNSTLLPLVSFLEEAYLRLPVIDQTGLDGRFEYDLKWNPDDDRRHHNLNGLRQALLDQMGLELVPARERIEMLVVEKAGD